MKTSSTRTSGLSRATRVMGLALLNLALVSPAIGQTTSIPLSSIEAVSVSGSQQSQIANFVDHWSQRATGSDSQQASRARNKLIEPLINNRVSISFRRTYSDALGSHFDQLETDAQIGSTLAALGLAGELGTSRGAKIILAGLKGDDLSVQIFAAGRAGRTFRTTAANGPALSDQELTSLIDQLESVSSSTNDQSLLIACIQGLGYGASLPSRNFLEARAQCMAILSTTASKQLNDETNGYNLESRVRLAMLASGAATNSLLQVGESSNYDGVRGSVALGADMIAEALMQIINNTMPETSDRELQVALVRAGESLLYFALREHYELTGRPASSVEQTQFADLLEAGEDRTFRNQAALMLGDGSPIVKDFSFAGDRFVN